MPRLAATTNRTAWLWFGAGMIVPIVALISLGCYMLARDRKLVEAEAQEMARNVCETLSAAIWNTLQRDAPTLTRDPLLGFRVVLDRSGNMEWPPPLTVLPIPASRSEPTLTSEQLALWKNGIAAEFSGAGTEAIRAYLTLLKTKPPADFSAQANYSLGLLYAKSGDFQRAADSFEQILPSGNLSDSGIPLSHLAGLQYLEVFSRASNHYAESAIELVCSNAVYQPSLLSKRLLDDAQRVRPGNVPVDNWRAVWESHERSRAWFAAFLRNQRDESFSSPVMLDTGKNFIWRREITNSNKIFCWVIPATDLALIVAGEIEAFPNALPEHAGLIVSFAGHEVFSTRWNRSAQALATALQPAGGPELLKVTMTLRDRAALFARHRQRAWLFGFVLGAAALTGLAGSIMSWWSFRRQLRLNELKSNFVASVSHELRAPLASVRLMAESLEAGRVREPNKQNEYFRFIVRECRRLGALIENVLDFSRIDEGRKDYQFLPEDLAGLIREGVRTMEPYAIDRAVKIDLRLNDSSAVALVDRNAIQQVLINLLDNAIKHSPPGGVVTIGLAMISGARIQVCVEDRGPGIAITEQAKIFERFYRPGAELRRETQGAGIGLSIVKHVIEAHRGQVRVESELGKGSKFIVELPVG